MKVFLQALGEQVWQAVEVGWIKPKEPLVDWNDATIVKYFYTENETLASK